MGPPGKQGATGFPSPKGEKGEPGMAGVTGEPGIEGYFLLVFYLLKDKMFLLLQDLLVKLVLWVKKDLLVIQELREDMVNLVYLDQKEGLARRAK